MRAFDRKELRAEMEKHGFDENGWVMGYDGRESSFCKCGDQIYPRKTFAAHQADVALAWFEEAQRGNA